ncbi:hypothetical protein CSV80_14455 [Sporosarcina sp. P12(2017)]|uniref:hypothetical protein n=2 Tax=unclassified Sporosarcina TaxID=2647733 RepID=UPI000C16D48A|nr:hypothetical protein [Sporosarcina sp. P10]PIC56448.1 hypothetical protein CSV81_14320 [Sporosarcina sp. P10]PIC59745.1 hypothetical protein CSV80_14455 [Sporosarcina sp. P12(2017)]
MFIMTSFLLLSACSEENQAKYSPSPEAALEELIQSEGIKGSIDLITTTDGIEILVIEQDKNKYFVGEWLEDKKGYTANRISANVTMELGGSWELKTNSKHTYTIYFEKKQEDQNFYPLSNEDYYISLVEGHQVTKEDSIITNAIHDIRTVKD